MVGKRFPVLLVVGSKFEKLRLLASVEIGAVGICGKRFRPKIDRKTQKKKRWEYHLHFSMGIYSAVKRNVCNLLVLVLLV